MTYRPVRSSPSGPGEEALYRFKVTSLQMTRELPPREETDIVHDGDEIIVADPVDRDEFHAAIGASLSAKVFVVEVGEDGVRHHPVPEIEQDSAPELRGTRDLAAFHVMFQSPGNLARILVPDQLEDTAPTQVRFHKPIKPTNTRVIQIGFQPRKLLEIGGLLVRGGAIRLFRAVDLDAFVQIIGVLEANPLVAPPYFQPIM